MARRVLKYGGKSLSSTEKILSIAKQVSAWQKKGDEIVLVVSAMGETTNELMALAASVSDNPSRRELDMLVSTGERVSMSLMSIALNDLGCEAISFTGSQAGILTDSRHSGARIKEVKAHRVVSSLEQGKVVVLAGFQGVCPETKEVTTLGRGGTDTTAVAIADFIGAKTCEMYKDVDGISNVDPKLYKNAKVFKTINYDQALQMTRTGAKILHSEAIEWAKKTNVEILVTRAHQEKAEGTRIVSSDDFNSEVTSISVSATVYQFSIKLAGKEKLSTSDVTKNKYFYDLELIKEHPTEFGLEFYVKGSESKLEFYLNWLAKTYELSKVDKSLSEINILHAKNFSTDGSYLNTKLEELSENHKRVIIQNSDIKKYIEDLARILL